MVSILISRMILCVSSEFSPLVKAERTSLATIKGSGRHIILFILKYFFNFATNLPPKSHIPKPKIYAWPSIFQNSCIRRNKPSFKHSFMDINTFEVIKTAYNSRLLFRTDSQHKECLGVTFETVSDKRKDPRMMTACYDALNSSCTAVTGESLRSLLQAYVKASDISQCIDFDWGERRQMASRKRFTRMLLRLVAAPTIHLSVAEELKFKPKVCDNRLIQTIFPDGISEGSYDPLIFLALLTFGIVRPYTGNNIRSRNITDKEASKQLSVMIELVKTIQDDMPHIGVLSKPLVFEQVLAILNDVRSQADYTICTPAWFWALLSSIVHSCAITDSPTLLADSMLEVAGYSMPGIWIDDCDNGNNRFWIFPENKYMAFCYSQEGESWTLTPFEFCFYSSKHPHEISDICVFVTAKGNRQLLATPTVPVDPKELATMEYIIRNRDKDGRFREISFRPITATDSANFNWNKFTRLHSDDKSFEKYTHILDQLYEPSSPLSALLTNAAPVMTDALNCLIAIDADYIYISDIRRPEKFTIEKDHTVCEAYNYNARYRSQPPRNLMNLEISGQHPLYLLPRNAESRGHVPNNYKRLIQAIDNTDIQDQITIYQTSSTTPKLLCFNRFSCIYDIDALLRDLSHLGANCITRFRN